VYHSSQSITWLKLPQSRTHCLVSPFYDRRWSSCVCGRCPTRTHLSHSDESRRSSSASLAPHGIDRMDRWPWSGWICSSSIYHGGISFSAWDSMSATYVSFSTSPYQLWLNATVRYSLVAMMALMLVLWALVPVSSRRGD
jgi:hypothetical protein